MYVLPKYLKNNKDFKTVTLGNILQGSYSTNTSALKHGAKITQNMFVYILSGQKCIHSNGEDVLVQKLSGAFIKRGTYIMSEIAPKYEALLFFYDNALIYEFLKKYPQFNEEIEKSNSLNSDVFHISSDSFLEESVKSALPYFIKEDEKYADIVKLKFEEIFLHILNSNSRENFLGFLKEIKNERESDLKTLIEANEDLIVEVEDMIALYGTSPATFRREFKKCFGTSPKVWLDTRKLERAKVLLESTNKNITEICTDLGFSSNSWFISKFKGFYGQTPKQYQRLKTDIN